MANAPADGAGQDPASADAPTIAAQTAAAAPEPGASQPAGPRDVSAKGTSALAAGRDAMFNATGPHARVSVEAFATPFLDVSVIAESALLERELEAGPEIDAWLTAERVRLARPDREPAVPSGERDPAAPYRDFILMQKAANDAFRSLAQLGMIEAEDQRTEKQFDAELVQHLIECREVLDQRADYLLLRNPGNWLRLSLVNNTETVFRAVQVSVNIHDARHLEPIGTWPKMPELRPWKARRATDWWRGGMSSGLSLAPYGLVPPSARRSWPQVEAVRSGVRVVFPDVDLRPGGQVDLQVIHVVPLSSGQQPCLIEWEATAINADGRCRGAVSLSTAASSVSPAQIAEGAAPDQRGNR